MATLYPSPANIVLECDNTHWQKNELAPISPSNSTEEDLSQEEVTSDRILRCRYHSKRCFRKRTMKKTGTLHSMCAYHRERANRNQRELEKRKREKKKQLKQQKIHELQMQSNTMDSANLVRFPGLTFSAHSGPTHLLHSMHTSRYMDSPTSISSNLEPFRTPQVLHQEDLDEIWGLNDTNMYVENEFKRQRIYSNLEVCSLY